LPLINIVQIEITGYEDTHAFDDFIGVLRQAFEMLGMEVSRSINCYSTTGLNVIIGANVIDRQPPADRVTPPANSVIYNLEQVDPANPWMSETYLALLRRYPVWDYNERNVARLRSMGVSDITLVPIGYLPQMTRIEPAAGQPIDVLFYGSVTPRREAVFREMSERGLAIHVAFRVYGAARDALIARAKLVLSLDAHDNWGFESVRISYLMANRKAVVCEAATPEDIDADLREGLCGAPYDKLTDTCIALLADEAARRHLELAGWEAFRRRDEAEILRRVLTAPG